MPTPIPDNSFVSVEFLMRVGSVFRRMKDFYFLYVFCLFPAVHLDKQVAILCFLNSFWTIPYREYLFYEERREFGYESGEVAGSFTVYDSDRFHLDLYLNMLYIFRWPSAPPPTMESNLCWE